MRIPKPDQIVLFVNIIVSVLLIAFIALQNRGTGVSSVFGGSGNIVQARRGVEKWLFVTTIIFAVLFVGLSVTSIILKAK